MPTLEQLAQVVAANPPDLVLLEQNGETCVVTVGTLLEPVQPRLTLASGVLLGRAASGRAGRSRLALAALWPFRMDNRWCSWELIWRHRP